MAPPLRPAPESSRSLAGVEAAVIIEEAPSSSRSSSSSRGGGGSSHGAAERGGGGGYTSTALLCDALWFALLFEVVQGRSRSGGGGGMDATAARGIHISSSGRSPKREIAASH